MMWDTRGGGWAISGIAGIGSPETNAKLHPKLAQNRRELHPTLPESGKLGAPFRDPGWDALGCIGIPGEGAVPSLYQK